MLVLYVCALMPAYHPLYNTIQHCCDFWPLFFLRALLFVNFCFSCALHQHHYFGIIFDSSSTLSRSSIHLSFFPYLSTLPFISFLTSKFSSVSLHSTACNHSNKVISSFFLLSVAPHIQKKNSNFVGILMPSGYAISIVFVISAD